MEKFKVVAKATHAKYGRKASAETRSEFLTRAMNTTMTINNAAMTTSASHGSCSTKKVGDHKKFRPICAHHSFMAAELRSVSN